MSLTEWEVVSRLTSTSHVPVDVLNRENRACGCQQWCARYVAAAANLRVQRAALQGALQSSHTISGQLTILMCTTRGTL